MAKARFRHGQCFYCNTHFGPARAPKRGPNQFARPQLNVETEDHVYPKNTPLPRVLHKPLPTLHPGLIPATGRNDPRNKVRCCWKCNNDKGNMHPLAWLTKIEAPDGARRLADLLYALGEQKTFIDRAMAARESVNPNEPT